MTPEAAPAVAAAFGLGRPTGPLVPVVYTSQPTWRLDTTAGRVFVKRVDHTGWRDELAAAMDLERRARAAGIALPRPVPPVTPTFGYVTDVAGWGTARAYEWVDGRAATADDDLAGWLGSTLARLHAVARCTTVPAPYWYGLHDEREWRGWLTAGHDRGLPWAPALRRHLPHLLHASVRIRAAFRDAADHVLTHRDVEPWNVLVTPSGPLLVDWDTAGPDSAGLELAHAAYDLARHQRTTPDATTFHAVLAAYREAGGGPVPTGRDALARRLGLHLGRIAERLRSSLGQQPPGSTDPAAAATRATEQLARLPSFTATLTAWASRIH
ncbi:aminoglycoside phosphotransferase family protein [Actinocatenispora rupis]|uniref:Aminoglycoside phosphotransferase domain-containing protein n=1 Tax=Actinocatenispora rupis TaxID=519421 RepID=A0A8J3IW76_9ACTN|nr:aminoglycoside phosphotransferase family protein [Actinocatenispora rupis]GID11096.1 hypothetical protein Aru02nite_19850 [Actinocatenispora rupis]